MSRLFRLHSVHRRDAAVEAWLEDRSGPLGDLARRWFAVLRDCGEDVGEVLHDGHPTACVSDVAFAYVDAFQAHVNVGFFHGAELEDPAGMLDGAGKFMRHVKLRPGDTHDEDALRTLVAAAYRDVKAHLEQE